MNHTPILGDAEDTTKFAETPASCDRILDFVLPTSMPVDDKDFFEMMFDK